MMAGTAGPGTRLATRGDSNGNEYSETIEFPKADSRPQPM